MNVWVICGVLGGICLWIWGFNLIQRYRCRHLPGPPPSWLIGNIRDVPSQKLYKALWQWSETYGPVYVWYLCRKPCIVLADPKLIKEATLSRFTTFHDRSPPPFIFGSPEEVKFSQEALFMSTGKAWAKARVAVQAFFTTSQMEKHCPHLNVGADKLLDIVGAAAAAGDELNIVRLLGRTTIEGFGSAAFGIDFKLQERYDSNINAETRHSDGAQYDHEIPAPDLLKTLDVIFAPFSLRSPAALFALVLAPLLRLLQTLGLMKDCTMPRLRRLQEARCYLWGILQGLLSSSRRAGVAAAADGVPVPEKLTKLGTRAFLDGRDSSLKLEVGNSSLFRILQRGFERSLDPGASSHGAGNLDLFMCGQGFSLFAGAYETTALAMSYTLYELCAQPDLQRSIAEEVSALFKSKKESTGQGAVTSPEIEFSDLAALPLTHACFLEGMRKWPPVAIAVPMSRHVAEDCYLGNVFLPKGTAVMFNVWAVHHNKLYYPDPESFQPERFMHNGQCTTSHLPVGTFFPFGLGPRACVGQRFAVAEGVICLAKLVERFEFRMDDSRKELNLLSGITTSPKNGIWVRAYPRKF